MNYNIILYCIIIPMDYNIEIDSIGFHIVILYAIDLIIKTLHINTITIWCVYYVLLYISN